MDVKSGAIMAPDKLPQKILPSIAVSLQQNTAVTINTPWRPEGLIPPILRLRPSFGFLPPASLSQIPPSTT